MIIPVRNADKFIIVDDEDYERLVNIKWYETVRGTIQGSGFLSNKRHSVASIVMRRKGVMFDHINRNPLDNRKENLRECSYCENAHNREKKIGATSQYKGVSFNSRLKKWKASLTVNGRRLHLGMFDNEQAAALAYNSKAVELMKEFACLNKV